MVLFAEGGPLYAKELHQFPRVFLPMALRGVGRNRCRGTPNLRGHPEGHLSGKRPRHPVAHLRESHPFLPNPQIPVRPNKPIFRHRLSYRAYSLLPIYWWLQLCLRLQTQPPINSPERSDYIRSRIVAVDMPWPMHMTCRPNCPSVASRPASIFAMRPAPVAPKGWPWAMAPPQGFTRSMSGASSSAQERTTEAKASFISIQSRSSMPSPAFSSARRVAGMTPVSCMTGSSPMATRARKRALGVKPSACALSRSPTSTAEAPSVSWEELPAVTTPSGLKTAFRPAIF